MQENEILIKSQKSQKSFNNFKKIMLFIVVLAIVYAFLPFLFLSVEDAIDSGVLMFFIIISLILIFTVAFNYCVNKSSFENIEWIITKTGITQLDKRNGIKTFIPTDHISSVSLLKNTVKITTVDLTRPQGLGFLENSAKIVEIINTLIYTTEKNKEITVKNDNIADEIVKYKKLCDDGVITKEEFEAKKKQLLGL